MKLLDWIEDEAPVLALSAVVGFFAAAGAAVLTVFVGARFFRDERTYGIPLALGLPAALVTGIAAFIAVFRKLRSR
jgi:hypothetical protein